MDNNLFDSTSENINPTNLFVLPPSNYQLENLDKHESTPENTTLTSIATLTHLPVDTMKESNMSGNYILNIFSVNKLVV